MLFTQPDIIIDNKSILNLAKIFKKIRISFLLLQQFQKI